jgi:hypothetical protein
VACKEVEEAIAGGATALTLILGEAEVGGGTEAAVESAVCIAVVSAVAGMGTEDPEMPEDASLIAGRSGDTGASETWSVLRRSG